MPNSPYFSPNNCRYDVRCGAQVASRWWTGRSLPDPARHRRVRRCGGEETSSVEQVHMKKSGLALMVLVILVGCTSATTTVAPVTPPTQPLDTVQWSEPLAFPFRFPQVVEGQRVPDVVLNVTTPWSSGRSSLLTPRPRCPRLITRLDLTGKIAMRAVSLDLAGSRPVPTLSNRCYRLPGAGE